MKCVVGVEAGQAGEVGEAGVGRQHEDQHRGACTNRKQTWPTVPLPKTPLAIWEMTVFFVARAPTCILTASHEMPRNMTPRQRAHDHEGRAGVLPLRLLERGHAVGDRLDAGHGGAAGGEGVEEQEHADRRRRHRAAPGRSAGIVVEVAGRLRLHDADDDDHHEHRDDEARRSGTAKMRPDSFTPRRLPQAMMAMKASAIGTR